MKKENFSQVDAQALKDTIFAAKKELFELRLTRAASQVKDYSQFKKLRQRIAQAYTALQQRELETGRDR